MAVLVDAIDRLGLDPDVVARTAEVMVRTADRVMATVAPTRGEASDYVAAQALRGVGLLALVDQHGAQQVARHTAHWLSDAKHPAWLLALGVLGHEELHHAVEHWAELTGYPADLSGYPADLARLAAGDPAPELGPDEAHHPAYTRVGLAPYRIDLRLLAAAVRGGNTVEVGYVSEPSAPAVVGALLGSVQDALDLVRADERTWALGAGPIAATDPELLLTLHALRRSPSGSAAQATADQHPQVEAVRLLVAELDPW